MMEKSAYSLRNITNDKIINFVDKKFKPQDDQLWELRLEAESKYIPIIQRDVENFLISLIRISAPRKILELGTAIGYSSMVMAKVLREIHMENEILTQGKKVSEGEGFKIQTIERHPQMLELANENIEKLGYEEEIEILCGDCLEIMKKLSGLSESGNNESGYDFIFIDAGKSHYLKFWQEAVKIVKKGGIIVCDNVFMRGMTVDSSYDIHRKHKTSIRNMREFLDYIIELENVHTSILSIGDGVSLSYIM